MGVKSSTEGLSANCDFFFVKQPVLPIVSNALDG
jgi:hypothetical protein